MSVNPGLFCRNLEKLFIFETSQGWQEKEFELQGETNLVVKPSSGTSCVTQTVPVTALCLSCNDNAICPHGWGGEDYTR